MLKMLRENIRTAPIFAAMDANLAEQQSMSSSFEYSVEQEGLDKELQVRAVDWNSTGNLLAVAYGAEIHEDW